MFTHKRSRPTASSAMNQEQLSSSSGRKHRKRGIHIMSYNPVVSPWAEWQMVVKTRVFRHHSTCTHIQHLSRHSWILHSCTHTSQSPVSVSGVTHTYVSDNFSLKSPKKINPMQLCAHHWETTTVCNVII